MNNVKKLTRREFARAIKLGHGRALLHVLHYGDKGIEDLIDRALMKNYVYDEQIEGTRRCYLEALIRNTGNVTSYAQRALKSFDYKQTSWLDCTQQIYICSFFFEHGFFEFRPMMFSKFRELTLLENPSLSCGKELVDVAGLSGLEFVAETIGNSPSARDLEFYAGVIFEHAEFILNGHTVNERMNELIDISPGVRLFMEAVRKYNEDKNSPVRSPQPVPTTEEFFEAVRSSEQGRFFFNSVRFARTAPDADILKVFDSLFSAKSETEQKALLKVFQYRVVPKFDARLFDFLETSIFQIRHMAADALGLLKHSAVRRHAIDLLNDKQAVSILLGLQMLRKNYRPSDHELLLSVLKTLKNRDDVHSAGMEIRHIAEEEGGKELTPSILWLYEHGPDTFCRDSFVEQLMEWGECPEEILFESQWDAGDELQMRARSHLNCVEQNE